MTTSLSTDDSRFSFFRARPVTEGSKVVAECCFCGDLFDQAEDSGLTFSVIPTREVELVWGKTRTQLYCHVECLASRVRMRLFRSGGWAVAGSAVPGRPRRIA
jgi:hypothetical protein